MRPDQANHWIGIDAAAYELPDAAIEIGAWAARHAWPRAQVDAILESGCRFFHAAPQTSEVELASRAIGALVDSTGIAPSSIDLMVHVHTQTFSMPAPPRSLLYEVAHAHGIRPLWSGSIAQLNCASIAAAIRMIDALFYAYPQAQSALVVSADRAYDEATRLRQFSGIQGDGAGCLLVTRNSRRNRVGGVALHNHAAWYPGSDSANAVERAMISTEWLHTHRIVDAACALTGRPIAHYERILPINTDLRGWHALCRALRVPAERLFGANVARCGHVCCSDFAINLADDGLAALDAGRHGMGVMQSNVGAFAAVALHPLEAASSSTPAEAYEH
ncbi:3-oxoacyl-ACP synthase [Burkholderia pseudomallei]|nr:3-oxoacyl-ACP synthase [Burkholderia pseudomallei]